MGSNRWLAIGGVVGGALIAVAAYSMGLAQGAAQAAAGSIPPEAYGYGWYRPWHFGFGFFPGFLFLVFFWIVFSRLLFWGGPWRRRWHYYPYDDSQSFDDRHRRAHERMQDTSGRPT
jgi:hypothetical protein